MTTPTEQRRDPLADIRDAADTLTDPRQHREPRWEWDHNRHRKPLPDHVVTLPGLIQQLRDLIEPGAADEGAGARALPESRPPGNLDAVSLLAAIEFGAAKRCLDLQVTRRATPESNIRAIVGAAGRLDYDTARVVAAELRAWQRQAEILAKWRNGAMELICPCPECAARGSLLVNPETEAAWCTSCAQEWPAEDSPRLFEHYRQHVAKTREAAARVKADLAERRTAAREAEQAARDRRSNGRTAA